MIWKSTVKPPFNPNPLTVIETTGNRIIAQLPGGGPTRVRDKNQFKEITKRPKALQPSWENGNYRPTNDPTGYDIEGNSPQN